MVEYLPDTNVGNIEYIRKNDASDWLKQYGQDVLHGKYKFSLMYIWKNIMDLPPADVVQVVRCRDCENWDTSWTPSEPDTHYCCMVDKLMEPDCFCCYGKRREG